MRAALTLTLCQRARGPDAAERTARASAPSWTPPGRRTCSCGTRSKDRPGQGDGQRRADARLGQHLDPADHQPHRHAGHRRADHDRREGLRQRPGQDPGGLRTGRRRAQQIPGAVDVFPDQSRGKGYLEINIDREKAARYGVNVGDIQDVIEMALGGKAITMTVEGRERFPVRVRYARAFREDEEDVKNLLVSAAAASMGRAAMRRAAAWTAAGWARRPPPLAAGRRAGPGADPARDGRRREDRRRPGHDQERERHVAHLRATERPRPRHRRLRRRGPAGRGPEGQAAPGDVPRVERPVREPGPRPQDHAGRLPGGASC